MIINQGNLEIIATAFCQGRTHDFRMFKENYTGIAAHIRCLGDAGYQGLLDWHTNGQTPAKKSKHHPLTDQQKTENRRLSQARIFVEHVIGRLKVFRMLSERYRNRRKRFGLRFNLIAAIYNLELHANS